ncbi:hypothetical protein HK097_002552 [Rhizophlyctis rosea]|uniref:Uncharacterized protein n=1 Tax=Rhizophlyctis rosea TaxID=64517 RepID=A0AAD5S4P2_9FUNG|nr:hypothetical protein HK097_002552 [Rhizophlyctis rosea]
MKPTSLLSLLSLLLIPTSYAQTTSSPRPTTTTAASTSPRPTSLSATTTTSRSRTVITSTFTATTTVTGTPVDPTDFPEDEPIVAISTERNVTEPRPDVYLNVPNLSVEKINLTVSDLEAHVSLKAAVGQLVTIQAGVDVSINQVQLVIEGVRAQLVLEARLNNVYKVLARTLDTLDRNPDILNNLVSAVAGLLSSVTNSLGQLVQLAVDAAGNLVEKVVASTGEILSNGVVGSVLDLPLVKNGTNEFGQKVSTFRHSTGNLIDVVFDAAGNVLGSTVQNAR